MLQPIFEGNKATFSDSSNRQMWKVGQTLTIASIIDHCGTKKDSVVLKPQGIAHLISEEEIDLPEDVCALAHVLTRKCNEGLLTLNIGVVDPGWKGRISTSVLNFGSHPCLLTKGDKFIRLTFHRIELEGGARAEERKTQAVPSEEEYVKDVSARAVRGFGEYFLSVDHLVNKVATEEQVRLRTVILKYLPIAALCFVVLTFFLNFGDRYLMRLAPQPAGQIGASSQLEIQELAARVAMLENKATESRAMRQPSAKLNADKAPQSLRR